MSLQNARVFFSKLKTNEELYGRWCFEIQKAANLAHKIALGVYVTAEDYRKTWWNAANVLELTRDAGLECTAEELDGAARELELELGRKIFGIGSHGIVSHSKLSKSPTPSRRKKS